MRARTGEPERAVVEALNVESALVHQPVMGRAQQDEVVEGGLPAVGPVLDVMAVEPMGDGAARKSASAVAARERAAHRRRNAAGAPPDAERLAVCTVHDRNDARIAAQPPGGLRRNGGAVLDFAASGPAVGKHVGLDMNDDFVAVGCERRRISGFEQPLGHPRQRIGAAHRARGSADERPTWDVGQEHLGIFSAAGSDSFPSTGIGGRIGGGCVLSRRPSWDVVRRQPFVVPPRRRLFFRMRGHRRIERAQDACTHLGREPPVQHHGAVVLVPEGEAPVLVLGIGPLGLLGALGAAMEADELLDMLRCAVQSDVQEVGLVPGGGDAGQRTHLGVAEFALGQRFGKQRQLRQRPGDTDLLARGMGIDAAGPAQPVGARQRPLRGPDIPAVEFGDEGEQPVRGGMDVGGEGGDGSGEGVVVHCGEVIRGEAVCNSHGIKRRM